MTIRIEQAEPVSAAEHAGNGEPREALSRLRLITDIAPIMLSQCNRDQRYTFVNRAYADRFGLTPEQIVGKAIWEVLGDEAYGRIRPYIELVLQGRAGVYEIEVPYKQIGRRFMRVAHSPEIDVQGRVVGWVSALNDITARKQAENALRESRERLNLAIESAQLALWERDLTTDRVISSERLTEIFGQRLRDGAHWESAVHPEDRARVKAALRAAIEDGAPYYTEYRIVRPDGSLQWVLSKGALLRDKDGTRPRLIGVMADISPRKRAEQEHRRRQQELTAFFENASIGLRWVGSDGVIQWVNPAELTMLGYTREEYEGHPIAEFHADRKVIDDVLARLSRGETLRDFEARMVCKDGSLKDVLLDASVLREEGRFIHAQCFTRDITAQKKAERDLRNSEERMSRLMSLMPAAVYACDAPSGAIRYYNRRAAELWGREPELGENGELCGSCRAFRLDGTPLPLSEAPMARVLRTGEPVRNEEVVIERPGGARITVLVNIDPIRGDDGAMTGAINVFQDITFHKQIQKALQQSAAQFRRLADALPQIVWTARPDGVIDYYNERWYEFTGFPRDEGGHSWKPILHPDDVPRCRDMYRDCIRSGRPYQIEYRFRDQKTGDYRWFLARAYPVHDQQGKIVKWFGTCIDIDDTKQAQEVLRRLNQELEARVAERTLELERAHAALLRDIEERKNLEEQLRQAQKMESVGTLAGGIAHDFNNILNIIQGYSSLIGMQTGDNREIGDSLRIIKEAISRAAGIVEQLLTLARKSQTHPAPTDINGMIRVLVELLKGTFPKTIDIHLDLDSDLGAVVADANQMNQALLNLCVNARDAMPDGGTLSIKTGVATGIAPPDRDGAERWVRIEVADTGTGMAERTRARIFDPFFTTKEPGQGTGLGLTVVYGIIRDHNGFVEVDSEPGRGATFRIYLPFKVVDGAWNPAPQKADKLPSEAVRGHGTVLLVEDEERQVDLLRPFLQQRGYRVLVARDGVDAVEIHRAYREEIAAVILDLGLPRLGGWEAFLRMKQEQPGVKTIFTSGYIKPEIRLEMIRQGVVEIMQKPYLPEELLDRIGAATGGAAFLHSS